MTNHIFFCLDENYIKYVSFVLRSFIKYHVLNLYQLNFIVYDIRDHTLLINIIKNISKEINYTIRNVIIPQKVKDNIRILKKEECIYSNYANWSRFYINKVYPEIKKGLYLDLDILFFGNIDDIFNIDFNDKSLAVVPYTDYKRRHNIEYRKNIEIVKKFEEIFNINYDKMNNNYNCGVIFYNYDRLKNLSKLIEDILEFQVNNERICKTGTEPIHNILFNDYISLDSKYNHIYKYNRNLNGIIIHFKGKGAYGLMNNLIKN